MVRCGIAISCSISGCRTGFNVWFSLWYDVYNKNWNVMVFFYLYDNPMHTTDNNVIDDVYSRNR